MDQNYVRRQPGDKGPFYSVLIRDIEDFDGAETINKVVMSIMAIMVVYC